MASEINLPKPRSFTLDTNCIIALENDEPTAPAIRALLRAHDYGAATVAVAAITASERQRNQRQLQNFSEFQQRLAALKLDSLEILRPIFYWDISFWDWCYWADERMLALERKIHEVLFPDVPFLWPEYCAANGLDPNESLQNSAWQNYKCDVLSLWSHIHATRDVFVTSDRNFHAETKKPRLIALGSGRIERAEAAAMLI